MIPDSHVHLNAHIHIKLEEVGNDTICLWFQLSNMKTLTLAEKEQYNLTAINCMLKAGTLLSPHSSNLKARWAQRLDADQLGGRESTLMTNPLK